MKEQIKVKIKASKNNGVVHFIADIEFEGKLTQEDWLKLCIEHGKQRETLAEGESVEYTLLI